MCNYTGHHFGASYEDGICAEGYLWDLDSSDGEEMTSGGEIPCPACNTGSYLDAAKEDAETTSWGNSMGTHYTGAMIMEGALTTAEGQNSAATADWKRANPVISTFDWPDRKAVLEGRTSPTLTNEVHLCL